MKESHIKQSNNTFDSYQGMRESATNWEHTCSYQLHPEGLIGEHHVIELAHMQLSYTSRVGGFMHHVTSPKDAISIALIQTCEGKACFGTIKLKQGDILFFDDSQSNYFMSNKKIEAVIVSLSPQIPLVKNLNFTPLLGKYINDKKGKLSTLLQGILETSKQKKLSSNINTLESTISKELEILLNTLPPQVPNLTKGEKVAFSILEKMIHHMDGKVDIASMASDYNISQKTLQNSFNALFGFTPKKFFRLLKLNLVHHDLQTSKLHTERVSSIASKWGFTHMGRFSHYYTNLFEENPSVTLKRNREKQNAMQLDCVDRKEELF